MKKGHNFKDYICSDSVSFKKDYFEFENKFGRFFLKDYASFLKDLFVAKLTDQKENMML